jgi:hypothetical protein
MAKPSTGWKKWAMRSTDANSAGAETSSFWESAGALGLMTRGSAGKAAFTVRLIYYSLARLSSGDYDEQWVQSIRSLRKHNRHVRVCLFVFNGVSAQVQREAARCDVRLMPMGDYREWLQRHHPRGSILARYPALHKFLVLPEIDTTGVSQALFVDCDTFFFHDPELLFDTPIPCHWSAREEPSSRLSHYGYDPSGINEELLAAIASAEGLHWVAPFNTGICLQNHGIWRTFGQLRSTFLDLIWRLLVGLHTSGESDGHDPDIRNAVLDAATSYDLARALPYPSNNSWILDQVAMWLTFGHLHDFVLHLLPQDRVSQGPEFFDAVREGHRPIVAHYFSGNQAEFFQQVQPLVG